MKKGFILLLFTLSTLLSIAQTFQADSLTKLLQKHPAADTTRVNLLNELAYTIYLNDPKQAKSYADESGEIANKLNYLKGKSGSLWVTGLTYSRRNEKKALDYFEKALQMAQSAADKVGTCNILMSISNTAFNLGDLNKGDECLKKAYAIAQELQNTQLIIKTKFNLAFHKNSKGTDSDAIKLYQEVIELTKETGDYKLLAMSYSNMGVIYSREGHLTKGLDCYFSALKVNEQNQNKAGIFNNLINIASIQSSQKDYESALKNIRKGFVVSKNMNDSLKMSICLTNIGNLYLEMNNPAALQYLKKALKMSKNQVSNQSINILTNIGTIYTQQKKFEEASKSFEEALAIAEKTNLKYACCEVWEKMSMLYHDQKKYNEAITYAEKALSLAQKINYLRSQKECYALLAKAYAATGSFENAYRNHVQYKAISDTLFNEEVTRETAIMENSYKYEKEKQAYEVQKISQNIKIKSQKQVILFLVVTSALILMLAFAIYWSNRLKKKLLKLKIEKINHELEANQKAMAAATLKLIQNTERDTYSLKILENIKTKTIEEGQSDIRSLITEYKLKSYNSNWEEFEILFEKTNASFYKKLHDQFPDLTTNERRLCVFLKLNMTNSHISQITFQSEEALKKARLRLRKKINLDREVSLTTFIQSL